MLYPTEYNKRTQAWMANPGFYSKFGLPGHEGWDGRAPTGSKLFAPVDGTVSEVGFRSKNHAYGYAFRIQFKLEDGLYEVIMAHGNPDTAQFKKGDKVSQGDFVMEADNTGNSSAAHLHLSLKKCWLNGKAPKIPTWVRTPLDYIILKNGEILINPEPFMIPFAESQKILAKRKTPVKLPRTRNIGGNIDKP